MDRQRRGHYQKFPAHSLYIGKMFGNVFACLIVDGIVRDGVVALSGFRAAASGTGLYRESGGKAVNQNVRCAGQGLPVIIFARALRHKSDSAVPCPVAICCILSGPAGRNNIIRNVAGLLNAF